VFFTVLVCTGSGLIFNPDSGRLFFNVRFCTGADVGVGGSVGGLLSVSATTFFCPGMCRKSVVNSEMYASCRTCRADHGAETHRIANVNGK
jgi:hypothetical protein